MDSVKILVIDRDERSRSQLVNLLSSRSGYNVKSESSWGEALFESLPVYAPDIIIINLVPEEGAGLRLAEKIMRLQADRQPYMIITSPQLRPELIRSAIRIGIKDFLSQPYDAEEINSVIQSAVKFHEELERQISGKGHIFSFFGAKGGVGCTTLSVNVGVVCAQEMPESKVLLIDLNLQSGHDALFLNLRSKYSLFDVVQNIEKLDIDILLKTLPRHASGLYLLPGLFRIEEAEMVTAQQVGSLLEVLNTNFELILIDNHPFFNDISLKALDASDKILLISTLDLPTIYNSKRCLELFNKLNYPQDKILVVLNRYEHYAGLNPAEMEKVLHWPVFGRVTEHDIGVVTACVNHGVPIVLKSPNCKMSEDLIDIALQLIGKEREIKVKPQQKAGLFSGFFKRQG